MALEQLATHIPDMVLYRSHLAPVPQITHCYGVIMFLDVSGTINMIDTCNNVTVYIVLFHIAGFTVLCENYCSDAKSKHDGTDQLTTTLNHYLSQIVQGIEHACIQCSLIA